MESEKAYSFQVNLKGMIALLSEHLYSDPNTFVRELLQNAVDAITALRFLDAEHIGQIDVYLPDAQRPEFVFQDNGIGLKEADIHQFLSVIGESSKGKDVHDAKEFIGKFGIGLLSCFVVSNQIIVETKSAIEKKSLRWIANAEGDYKIEAVQDDLPIGTRVILKPKEQFNYIFEQTFLKNKLQYYGDALREKITLHRGNDVVLVNAEQPRWLADADREELLAVGKQSFNVSFLDAIPFQTDAGKCRGVLFILPFKTPLNSKQHHRVYLKRMFLSEEDQSLLPGWAFFFRMLINTDDLHATASRESLMKNDTLQQARKEIAAALKAYLGTIKTVDYGIYNNIIRTHFFHLKAFALEDLEFLDIFLNDIPFETNRGHRNFKEIADYQEVVYYCADFENFKQIDRIADTQGILLINASYTFDTELLKRIKQRYKQRFSIEEMSPSELLNTFADINVSEKEQLTLFRKRVEKILDTHGCVLEIRHFQPVDTTAIYTKIEQSNVDNTVNQLKENANPFARILKSGAKPIQKPILCFNASNELIQSITSISDTYLLQSVVEVLLVQAMILGKYPIQEREMKIFNEGLKNLIVMGLTNFVNI